MSENIYTKCPHCGASGFVPETLLGTQGACNDCKKSFVIQAHDRKRGKVPAHMSAPITQTPTPPFGWVDEKGRIYLNPKFGTVMKIVFFVFIANLIIALPLWLLIVLIQATQ